MLLKLCKTNKVMNKSKINNIQFAMLKEIMQIKFNKRYKIRINTIYIKNCSIRNAKKK